MSDPKLRIGANFCKCTACGKYFNSEYPFGKHRRGGECLTVEEMLKKGFSLNEKDYWISSNQPNGVRGASKEARSLGGGGDAAHNDR